MAKVKAIPEGYNTITPNLVSRDAAGAIEFYKKVFGAKVRVNMPDPSGGIMHAELQLGDSLFFINDVMGPEASAGVPGTSLSQLHIYIEDVDSVYNRAVAAGAKVVMPLQNMFWGDRYGVIEDPFGQRWGVATHIEDVSPEEMKKRQKAAFGKAAG